VAGPFVQFTPSDDGRPADLWVTVALIQQVIPVDDHTATLDVGGKAYRSVKGSAATVAATINSAIAGAPRGR